MADGVNPDAVIQHLATKIARLEVTNSMLIADRDAWKARAEQQVESRGGMVDDDAVADEVPDPGA